MSTATEPATPAKYLDRPSTAKYLRVSLRLLDSLTPQLRPIRLGRRVVFDVADLDDFMASRKGLMGPVAVDLAYRAGQGR